MKSHRWLEREINTIFILEPKNMNKPPSTQKNENKTVLWKNRNAAEVAKISRRKKPKNGSASYWKTAWKKDFLKSCSQTLKKWQKNLVATEFQNKFLCKKLAKFSLLAKNGVFPRRIAEKIGFGFAWRFSKVLIWGSGNVHASCFGSKWLTLNCRYFIILGLNWPFRLWFP